MRFVRLALGVSLLLGVGFLLGCGDKPKTMQNMEPGTGPPVHKDLQLKKVKKPMPVDPAAPKPPPLTQ